MSVRSIHPFPARMAPDLAIAELTKLRPGSRVLDPMAGSGTVLRQASELGHRAIGTDMDPLAVLMARVWNTRVADEAIDEMLEATLAIAKKTPFRSVSLPWIDSDPETKSFIDFWFANRQKRD